MSDWKIENTMQDACHKSRRGQNLFSSSPAGFKMVTFPFEGYKKNVTRNIVQLLKTSLLLRIGVLLPTSSSCCPFLLITGELVIFQKNFFNDNVNDSSFCSGQAGVPLATTLLFSPSSTRLPALSSLRWTPPSSRRRSWTWPPASCPPPPSALPASWASRLFSLLHNRWQILRISSDFLEFHLLWC